MYRAMLVGDNRDRANVGCRATSIALSSLLETTFEITSRVSGSQVEDPQPARLLRGNRIARKVAKRSTRYAAGWRGSALLPPTLRPDQVMAPPEQVARSWLESTDRVDEVTTLVREIDAADVVIVNGEGDLILTTPPRRKLVYLLAVVELAHLLDTPCMYVNAMASDPPAGDRNPEVVEWARQALSRCRLVALRDQVSLALAEALELHASPRWIPDALFTWSDEMPAKLGDDHRVHRGWPYEGDDLDLEWEHYVCVSGSSAFQPGARRAPLDAYQQIVERLTEEGHQPVLVESSDAEPYLRSVARRTGAPLIPWTTNIYVIGSILGRSQLLLSGRHHPAILAALGGSRPVMFGSNSHKCASLLDLLGLEPVERSAELTDANTRALLDDTRKTLTDHGPEAREQLRRRCSELATLARDLPNQIRDAMPPPAPGLGER